MILAVLCFAGLPWYSRDFLAKPEFVAPADTGAFARHRMFVAILWFLKWIIPVALLIGGAVSAIRARRM